MNDLKILQRINQYPNSIFSVSDLGKILNSKEKNLRTVIHRLSKRGVIQKLGRGWYSAYNKIVIPEQVTSQIYYPSYLSLKTVLSKVGVVNQIPRQIYSVTLNKSYQAKINNILLVYRQVKRELFFGFYQKENQYIAYPEKALLDLIYFVSRGVETVSWQEMDLSRLNKKKLFRWVKSYPSAAKKYLIDSI
ncbi:hypothetical protein A2767_01355 [Candidatus Roizmanbacteria bacterium RIFCSPHIGHO2_01_FULL_35_10]|uniref:AbiEi antitoxin C-terminal domain-containing protein n=1 Tax=Candidatus Roizmanbacteria bacterium RIFCSPLOWO2_01_FULL_35_13 TaxID=1802055 RepID=A0A1F7IH38_9BACT|nr:MAG: hypothetical protein A2767_01355 [Candidatus Roizmanbacteria bacterium RIFCSPHIGHO2_01_FULL_35_10]OGK42686.1 MAG: hypothetical protein A3A74_00060 [Candidatus Roizmanbacteria bacterium RIFCSPLOWO2_01_FULL_35_13]